MSEKKRHLVKVRPREYLKETKGQRGHYVTCIKLNAKGLKKLREAEKQISNAIPVKFADPEKVRRAMEICGLTEEDCDI